MGAEQLTSPIPPGSALFDATRRAILRLLFGNPQKRFYQREIIRRLAVGSGAVQRDIARFTRAGILVRTVEGRQTYYQANAECPIFPELRGLIRKTFGITEVLQNALCPLSDRIRFAFVFGSIASGAETASSDIDVMIVGERISMHDIVASLATVPDELGREVNPSIYGPNEFRRKLAEGQHFLSTVTSGPKLFLIGDEGELTRLAEIRMAQGAQDKRPRDRRPVRTRRPRS